MDRNQERGAIAHNVQNVLSSFRNVGTSFKQSAKFPDDRGESEDLLRLISTFENEITRFKMWAGNLAAHQSGPASLDHRLREAPHVQEQVVYLLCDISESLKDAIALISHEDSPKGTKDTQDEPAPLQKSTSQGSDDDFTDSDLDDDEDVSLEIGLSSLCADISEATDCLLRLSVAIANPAPHERFRKLGAGPSEDVSFYEAHDIRYVRDKFPRADKALPDVLGKFITRRRQFFKYREAHHAKLAAGLDQETQKDTSRTEIIPKTIASSLPEHFKGTTVIDEDNRSDTAVSETSYATSAGFLMQEDGQMKPAPPLKVPPPPPEAEKGAFECPFCYRMISASTRRAWKRHVFGDLRPYTCLFSRCTESNTDFDRRHRWQLHVAQYHWRTWSCPFKCKGMFPSSLELRDHIRHQHLPNAHNEHLNTVVARGEVPVPYDISKECPLCGHSVSGLNSYIRHVGRHLEQLALFALPDIKDELPEDEFESDEQNDVASEINAESVGSDTSEVSSRAHESREQLETSVVGDEVDLQIRSEEREEPDYNARTIEDSDERSVDGDNEHGRELPHLQRETTEPPTDRDDDDYSLHGLNQPLGGHGGLRRSPHLTVPDEPLEELQWSHQDSGNITNEVTEEHKSIPGTEESPNEARRPSMGDSPPSQNLTLLCALRYANTAVQLENNEDFQGAKETFVRACKFLDQSIQVVSGSKMEGTFQSIRHAYISRVTELEEKILGQGANVGSEAASETEQLVHPAAKDSDSVTTSGPPSLSSRPQKPSTDESEGRVGASTERTMTEQQDIIIDPITGPVVQDGRPIFTRMARRHLSIETLRTFGVDFEFDTDPEYILIRRWVPEPEQDRLWKHTKSLRERRRVALESEKWKPQEHTPEFVWVRRKKPERRRNISPSLLMYLAGVKPSEEANQTEEPDEQPYSPSGSEASVQEQEGGDSEERSEHLITDDEETGKGPLRHREDVNPLGGVRRLSLPFGGEFPSIPTAHEEPDAKTPPGEGPSRLAEELIEPSPAQDDVQWAGWSKTVQELNAREAEDLRQCPLCWRWFKTKADAERHIDAVHGPSQNAHEAQGDAHADLDSVQAGEGSDILQHGAQDAAGDAERTEPGMNRSIEK